METVRIDPDRCTLCGSCTTVCVRRILTAENDIIRVTDPSRCILCGHCKAVCVADAVQLPSLDPSEFGPVPAREELPTPAQLMALLRCRRSTRIFRDDGVERETIARVIEAGRFAPTGGNLQALRHVVVRDPKRMASIRDITVDVLAGEARAIEADLPARTETGKPLSVRDTLQNTYAGIFRETAEAYAQGIDRLFYHAPVLVVTHAKGAAAGSGVDAGLSAMQMVLMAEALGLGTCFIGFVVLAAEKSPSLTQALHIPEDHKALVSFVTGYPDVPFLRLVSRKSARVRWLE